MFLAQFKQESPVLTQEQYDWYKQVTVLLHESREAHAAMDKNKFMSSAQYNRIRQLVFDALTLKVAPEYTLRGASSWPVEAIAFHIMENWHSHKATIKALTK